MQRLLDDREAAREREENADLDLARRACARAENPWRGNQRAARQQSIPHKPASVDRHHSAPLCVRHALCPGTPHRSRRSTLFHTEKTSRSDRSPKTQLRRRRFSTPQNKKARRILTDPSGYLARARPATLMVRRMSRNITRL